MFNYQITFEAPWYLLLLALLPALWWFSLPKLRALGRYRRLAAVALRSIVLVLLIFTLAEIQMVRTSDRLTVIYLLDQSLSIPVQHRQAMIKYVNAAIKKHRRHEDRVGVIVFGRDAAIEIPPFDDDVQMAPTVESLFDPEYTNLSGAMKLAQASFPEDAAKRIVIVSDGNQNIGDAVEQAQGLAGSGIGIDVLPIRYQGRAEVVVERVTVPNDVRSGQPFDLKVVVTNTNQATEDDTGEVPGRLIISQLAGEEPVELYNEPRTLPPGKKVFAIRQQIDASNFYTYEARFVPDRPGDDAMPQNNRATTYTHVRGRGQVLLIEDAQNRGEFARMVDGLRLQDLEITVRPSSQIFSNLAQLQPFDTVVLANVPREDFSDEQIRMLVRNTQQMGAGLVMLGGPNSFGAGGWTNTELEEAMPVDFQIKSAKVVARGALAMILHACEIPQGNHWQKKIGREALKALGARDYCGVVHYGSGVNTWLWKPALREVGNSRKLMLARMDRMTPGDMPDFDPAMIMAQKAFARVPDAAVKHMIIISDGDPSPPSGKVLGALVALNVTVSTVAVAAHGPAESALLKRIANRCKGKFYAVNNPRALPKIFQREARRVARPLIYKNSNGFRPRVRFPHEMISGIADPLPPITGYVQTTVKDSPLVEVALLSPEPTDPRVSTILASWTYGLGKAVAWTTDAGARWANRWTQWNNYDRLFSQVIRWSMRPVGEQGKFTVASDVEDGQVRMVVTALDKDDEFLNFLDMSGTVVGPDLEPVSMKMQQTAPGRYVGAFPAGDSGSYFVMVSPGAGKAPIRTGINVPYSDEFRDRAADEALLGQLAGLVPKGGSPGVVIPPPKDPRAIEPLLAVNTFRHDLSKATSSQDIWYYVVLVGTCLFFFDVFIRRVQISFGWVPVLAGRTRDLVLRRQPQVPEPEFIQRLRSRKAEVDDRLQQLRSSTRFEMSAETPAAADVLEELTAGPTPERPKPPEKFAPSITAEKQEEESYTERLLRAKKKVWEQRKK